MMKNTQQAYFIWFFLGILLFTPVANATGPRVSPNLFTSNLDQLYALEYPPFITAQSTEQGVLFELINTVLKQQNIAAEINILPSQNMVKYYYNQETALAMIGHDFNLTRRQQKNSRFIPVLSVKEYFFYYQPAYKDGFSWNGKLSAFKAKTYGANKGDDVDAYKKAGIKIKYHRLQALVSKLRLQDVDFIREPELTVNALIDSTFPAEKQLFIKMEPEAGVMDMGVVFNTQHINGVEIAKKFSQGLKIIKANGQYQAVINKYQLSD